MSLQIARDKHGRLVIGYDLVRLPKYRAIKVERDTPYGIKEIWVDDKTQPLPPTEWTGAKLSYPKNENNFSNQIQNLKWENEPINL